MIYAGPCNALPGCCLARCFEADKIGEGGTAFLCRATGFEQVEQLQAALQESYTAAADIIGRVIEEGQDAAQ